MCIFYYVNKIKFFLKVFNLYNEKILLKNIIMKKYNIKI